METKSSNINNCNYEDYKQLPDLIDLLKKYLESKHKKEKQYFINKGPFYEPVGLWIMMDNGKVTSIKSMEHMFGLVKYFSYLKEIFFHIQLFKQKEMINIDEIKQEKIVIFAEESISKLRPDTQNFIDTLDDLSKKRINEVQEWTARVKTDKEVYDLLIESKNNIQRVIDIILPKEVKSQSEF